MADDASQELARFDAEVGMFTAPFASILLRSESASSSEVENLTSSAKQLALAEIGESKSGNARLVVANVRAMNAAIDLSDHLTEDSIITMHDALLRDTAPEYTGHWRKEQGYFNALTEYRAGNPAFIVSAVAQASFAAVQNGRALVRDIQAAAKSWESRIIARSDSSAHRVREYLLRQPVINTRTVAEELDISEVAAQGAIDRLVDADILTQISAGRRNRIWQATEILAALDAFGERSRRSRN